MKLLTAVAVAVLLMAGDAEARNCRSGIYYCGSTLLSIGKLWGSVTLHLALPLSATYTPFAVYPFIRLSPLSSIAAY